ncbi:MAG: hypothetical protein JSW27_23355 [Phycisphaerales bacterium]|nr:MAG: hypothetical protein JSW27_23355 [Phycisphaerales bacterium]
MTPADRTEDVIRNTRQTTDVATDQRILARAEAALAERNQTPSAHLHLSGLIRRVTMNKNHTRWATAAAILVTALIGLHALTGSIDGTSITLAQVRQAMDSVNWMKIVNEGETVGDGRAEIDWFSFADQVHIQIDMEGRIVYQDYQGHRKLHWPASGNSIYESPLAEDREFAHGAAGPFEMIDASLRLIQAEHEADVTRELGSYQGQEAEVWTVRWDRQAKSGATRTLTIYFDTEKKLPIGATFDHGRPGGSYRESHIEFEYPETGPADIYEAGAPASAPIVPASEN